MENDSYLQGAHRSGESPLGQVWVRVRGGTWLRGFAQTIVGWRLLDLMC